VLNKIYNRITTEDIAVKYERRGKEETTEKE